MAQEPSAKRHQGETSDQSSNLNDVHVPGEKREYTRTLTRVELHGKETLEIVCTSEPDKADKMIGRFKMKSLGLYPRFIDVDVEFTRRDEPLQMAAVMQLCIGTMLGVPHRSSHKMVFYYTKRKINLKPKHLKNFLKEHKLYTFVGFSIEDDKQMMKRSGLEIDPKGFIDIQRNWRVPYISEKEYDSLADVAASVIHPFYKGMKNKIDKEKDLKLWGISPLPDYLIEYAATDAYATYKSWKIIDNITVGAEISKAREAGPYYHCHYAG
ncbi:hypothetical protein CFC21_041269 [Triticum aestivum]|uniref:3'-5' exonuclease domain-containing protein n=2 Tax=Triticum aestivum TaxID=4565 RepID=A0A9R1JU29_WHEAT|nr:hypothetical protein CFC21_041269 [Triticum aestivum]CDM83123.1 unnamed protein product [Triticum aestivum]